MRLLRAVLSWLAANVFSRSRHQTQAPDDTQSNADEQRAPVTQHAVRLEVQIDPAVFSGQQRSEQEKACRDKLRLWIEGATLVALIVYAIITLGLFSTTQETLNETKRNNERTTRAYVLVPRVDLIMEPTPLIKEPNALIPSWGIRIALHNFGKTPAGITESGVLIVGYPPDPFRDRCPTNYPVNVGSNILVPPQDERAFYGHGDPFNSTIKWVMDDRMKRGMTVYGHLTYIDAFKRVRPLDYCYTLLAPFMTTENIQRYIYGRDKPERSAFTQCDRCNSWEPEH